MYLYCQVVLCLTHTKIKTFMSAHCVLILTHLTLKLPSYRNQSIDLQSKSIDWFLYMATLAFELI